jgi:HAD superfamily hydrolase (TIGR01459 family)
MESLVKSGKIVGILSNSSQLAAKEIDKLQNPSHGLIQGVHYHFLLTSGEIARQAFLQGQLPYKRYWVFCNDHPKFNNHQSLFAGTSYIEAAALPEADFVYIGVPHCGGEDQTNPEQFREALATLRTRNLPLVCANPDKFAHEGNPPRSVVRQGSIAKLYEDMGGQVIYFGKPHKTVFEIALRHISQYKIMKSESILMVGDTPETDILGAKCVGIDAALVTTTGIMADRIEKSGIEKALQALSEQETPKYYIEQL